jgi:hypothetical protein
MEMAPPAEAHRIFFSHRHRDEPVTKEIISILHRHTENVRCFISEHIERGAKWRSAIAEQLKLSGFLVLVFTDPEEDWGWCLYETGFFDALSQLPGETRRIYSCTTLQRRRRPLLLICRPFLPLVRTCASGLKSCLTRQGNQKRSFARYTKCIRRNLRPLSGAPETSLFGKID